jgi:hypothetical protein
VVATAYPGLASDWVEITGYTTLDITFKDLYQDATDNVIYARASATIYYCIL